MTLQEMELAGVKPLTDEQMKIVTEAFVEAERTRTEEKREPSPDPIRSCQCGGSLAKHEVHKPFDVHTVIGSRSVVLFTYWTCETCKLMYSD